MSSESIIARGVVTAVERVSPAFVRVTFGGPELADFGVPGGTFDQRIKLIFPASDGSLPPLAGAEDWYDDWLTLPESARGSMRTYSIRSLHDSGAEPAVVIDFVLHLEPGLTGPASLWAASAAAGAELLLIGPRRGAATEWGGVEYAPGAARSVVLAGDETAAPAIARILEDSPDELRGVAFIEVPEAADALPIAAPPGVRVAWLARDGLAQGEALIPQVLAHLGAATSAKDTGTHDAEVPDVVWETPTFSGSGEDVGDAAGQAERYFWIAGESRVVTTLRRHLVKDLGIDRSQVAFMGYWREGVAMRG